MAAAPPTKRKRRKTPRKPRGRYDAKFCELLVEEMTKGHSIVAFAGHPDVKVGKSTVYDWIKKHKEFEKAYHVGKAAAIRYWEEKLISASTGQKSNIRAITFALTNMDSEIWRDKVEYEHGGKVDEPVVFEVNFVTPPPARSGPDDDD